LVARDDADVPGLAIGARLIAIDAFHKDASGQDVTDAFDFARALDRVQALNARVLNLSIAGPDHPVVARLIAVLNTSGVIIVAAAGNDGPRARPLYPAAYPGVIGVTAVHPDGAAWRGAARGEQVDVAATGVNLVLAGPDGGVATFTGTSFAAPIVSAILAGEAGLTDGASAVERLSKLARDAGASGRDERFGYGILEPARACGG
jgi:subtilisin family serine protease